MKSLKHKIIKTEMVDWKELVPFQPESLKKSSPDLLKKLSRNMINNGFTTPFFVWQKGKIKYILDGCHRQKVLEEMSANSTKIPDKLPAIFLRVKDEQEAKKYLLGFNSYYAEINKKGLFEFIEDFDIEEIKLEFEPIKLGFNYNIIDEYKEKEIDIEDLDFQNKCPKCNYEW